MPKELVAIHAITHKPKTKVETVVPGARFTPANEEEREALLRSKAARELTEAEAADTKKAATKKTPAKKTETPKPDADKAVTLDPNPGDETADSGGDLLG